MDRMNPIYLIIFAVVVLLGVILAPQMYDCPPMGKYHITQSPFSGEVTARMEPKPYMQMFARIEEFPVSETFFFTADEEGGKGDTSITVQFNDGSTCRISGTCRVDLPKDGALASSLLTEHGYRNMDQIEDRLILPTIRRSMVLTANQMTAKESYAEKRAAFIADSWDQITNGVYIMKDVTEKVKDEVTGKEVTRTTKVPVTDERGVRMREKNPFAGLGVTLANFEVKSFIYEEKVKQQISTQQQAIMDVQTAKANALKAEQDSITTQKMGEAAVMKAKYVKEEEKIKAEVDAQKEASVAVISAQKLVDVATKEKEQALVAANRNKEVALVELEAAKLEKQRQIELGTGESERRKMILAADGALDKKLEALVQINGKWADAFSKRQVPGVMMGGTSGSDKDAVNFMEILGVKAAKDLAMDPSIRSPEPKK